MQTTCCRSNRGFTLVEMIFVIAIISLLSALLLPVFWTARGRAQQAVCASNLRQIGLGFAMYAQDYDGRYPVALDVADRYTPEVWAHEPEFQALIPSLPMLHDALHPYTKSPGIFGCPSDTGYDIGDFTGVPLEARPSAYEKFGLSYYYRTEIAVRRAGEFTFSTPEQVNVLFDAHGLWHGTLTPPQQRYNTLFADGHIKNVTRERLSELWKLPLSDS